MQIYNLWIQKKVKILRNFDKKYTVRSMASGFSLLSVPVKGRFLIHAEGSAGDDSTPSKILQVTDDMEE
jgi:hypothetical protein